MKQIIYEGISLAIDRRRIKNVNLYIKPPDGDVLITAPHHMSEQQILLFVKRKRSWIEKKRAEVKNRSAQQVKPAEITEEQREHMQEMIRIYLNKWEPVMGVHATHITIRDMKTRWGSCTVRTGRIRLNLRLAAFPDECLEYIIVHELCHLLEPSHNHRFKSYMDRFLPDWKERRERLR